MMVVYIPIDKDPLKNHKRSLERRLYLEAGGIIHNYNRNLAPELGVRFYPLPSRKTSNEKLRSLLIRVGLIQGRKVQGILLDEIAQYKNPIKVWVLKRFEEKLQNINFKYRLRKKVDSGEYFRTKTKPPSKKKPTNPLKSTPVLEEKDMKEFMISVNVESFRSGKFQGIPKKDLEEALKFCAEYAGFSSYDDPTSVSRFFNKLRSGEYFRKEEKDRKGKRQIR